MVGTVIVAIVSGFVGYSAWVLQTYASHRQQIREVTAALLFEAETNRAFAHQLIEHGHPGNYLRDEAWVSTKNSGHVAYIRPRGVIPVAVRSYDALHRLNLHIERGRDSEGPVSSKVCDAVQHFDLAAFELATMLFEAMAARDRLAFERPLPPSL